VNVHNGIRDNAEWTRWRKRKKKEIVKKSITAVFFCMVRCLAVGWLTELAESGCLAASARWVGDPPSPALVYQTLAYVA